jgi:Arc/MetJ family transcription regulator
MRTNIEIEDELIRKALSLSGLKTTRAAARSPHLAASPPSPA